MNWIIASFLATATALSVIFLAIHLGFRAPRRIETGNPGEFGAGAVLFEASRRHDIAAVISIAAFAHPEWVMRRYLGRFRIPEFLTVLVLRYVEWVIGHRYDEIAPMNTVCRANCPVLLVHGEADTTVPVTDALAIRDNCPSNPIELIVIENANHESVEMVEEHSGHLLAFLERVGVVGQRLC